MARKRARPSDPLALAKARAEARRDAAIPATWGLDAAALSLPANAAVVTTFDLARRPTRARRSDVFDLLLARGRLSQRAFDAVRRLERDIALLHRGSAGVGGYEPRVDRARSADAFNDVRLDAGRRIEAALALAGPASANLLRALLEEAPAQGCDWRAVIERHCGERLADAQGAVLRLACENLAGAYGLIDQARRRRERV
jgi:hypothetical protein